MAARDFALCVSVCVYVCTCVRACACVCEQEVLLQSSHLSVYSEVTEQVSHTLEFIWLALLISCMSVAKKKKTTCR